MAAAIVVAVAVASWVLTPPARKGLVLYAAGEGAAPIAARFTRATGVPVTVVRLSTGPLLARIAAEGLRPGWTLAWFDGDTAAANLDRAGLLARGATPAAAWTPVGQSLVPEDGAWTPVAFTLAGVDVELNRRGRRATDGVPVPALGIADPALSGPAFTQIAGVVSEAGGWPQGRRALADLQSQGLSVAATSPSVVMQLLDGRVKRALLQSGTAYFLGSHDPRVRIAPRASSIVLANVIVEAAALPTPSRADAARFLRYMTSQPTQNARLRDGRVDAFAWPTVATTAVLPTALPALAPLRLSHLDPYRWGAVQADVIDAFETEVARR